MLPPISYKVHPKLAEILEEKRKMKDMLLKAKLKEEQERQELAKGRKQYIDENRKVIANKVQDIYEKKLVKHNRIREQDKQRSAKILIKRSEILMKMVPERRQFIQKMKNEYLEAKNTNDGLKQQKIKKMIQARIVEIPEILISEKIRQNNLIDTNEGICVICLTSQAHLFMTQCRHLISCKDCEFILRMQKKCPLCRKFSNYQDLKKQKKHRKSIKK